MAYMTCVPTGRTLMWRGIPYPQKQCMQGPFPATLYLTYRGREYRPATRWFSKYKW